MIVRNFYATIENDGKRGTVSAGPQGKGEGFKIEIKQRDNGDITDAAWIRGRVRSDGRLELSIMDADNNVVHTHVTER